MTISQFARGAGLLAAAAALSACSGDITVNSGGALPAAPLPLEERLGADRGADRPYLVDRKFIAALPAAGMAEAAGGGPGPVDFTLGQNRPGSPVRRFTYSASWTRDGGGEGWTVDSEEERATFDNLPGAGGAEAVATVRKWTDKAGGAAGALLRAGGAAGGGQLWVSVTADASRDGGGELNSDWLATGLWAWTPGADAAAGHRFGVFAAGGEPAGANILRSVNGTSTYSGNAAGVWSRVHFTGVRQTALFEARATLTADFDATPENGYGHLSGQVSGFRSDEATFAGNPTLTLEQAVIRHTAGQSGEASGATSMTFDSNAYSGAWRAEFFGNAPPADAGGRPTSVAGTFGATVGSGARSQTIVGAFAARR